MDIEIIRSVILNIGLLVIIAVMLSRFRMIRRFITGERKSSGEQIFLILLFGIIGIISTLTGYEVHGAIANTRVISVIACPISSGDTAFRSARLVVADWFNVDQKDAKKRLFLTLPILGIGAVLTQMDVQMIWRYFSWSNQTLAMMALWAGAVYLFRNKKNSWTASIPATSMSGVSMTYILMAPEGFKLSMTIAYPVGILFALLCFGLFARITFIKEKQEGKMAA